MFIRCQRGENSKNVWSGNINDVFDNKRGIVLKTLDTDRTAVL